ncbi:MAG: phosphotransferase enzyme family protein [Phormidesmis sp.]
MSASLSQSLSQSPAQLYTIANQFVTAGRAANVEPLGNGNINSTFLVTVEASGEARAERRFVLQKINTSVFHQPELVMQNMMALSKHLQIHGNSLARRWEVPQLLPTNTGKHSFIDDSGSYWRAITFIDNAEVFEALESVEHAEEVGAGLGMFHSLISTLPTEQLADTLEGFHITPQYLAQYEKVLDKSSLDETGEIEPAGERTKDVQHCLQFVAKRKDWAHVLETAKAEGQLQLRPIHGDPKVNNIMLGPNGQAVSLIDLDTLKPGLVHYDIGDCLRSGCNRLGEETTDWQSVEFDMDLAQAMLKGYLSLASQFLTEQDYAYLYDGIRLIAFELGLRFFTDYLAGNVYFKVKHPHHNLDRALVQFQLTASIEKQEDALKALIESLR